MFGGSFRKFATDSNGISGTFCALALLCASLGPAASSPATIRPAMTHLFMKPPLVVDAIYTSGSIGSSDSSTISAKEDRVLLSTVTALHGGSARVVTRDPPRPWPAAWRGGAAPRGTARSAARHTGPAAVR